MAVNIIGVPTTRISNQFVTDRLMSQLNFDQTELYRLQAQLSTGLKFQRPGESPIEAASVLSHQMEMERKDQARENLLTTQSYLAASDTALTQLSNMMDEMRALGLEAINTTTSDVQRGALAQQVEQAVRQLMDAGNQKFRDRYLFAGGATDVRPFELGEDQYVVEYVGNELHMESYVDIDLLFASNMTGKDVFNAVSDPVLGSVDINPIVTESTLLADLNGGDGVALGSINIANGTDSIDIDLTDCETLGDVVQKIHDNPPTGSVVHAAVTPRGLQIWLDPLTPGNLQVHEVGTGTTARELGIYTETGIGMSRLNGRDLNPTVTKETSTQHIFGAQAMLACQFPGDDNDFFIRSKVNGAALNGLQVSLVREAGLSPGSERAYYDDVAGTLAIHISPEASFAEDVIDAINNAVDPLGIPIPSADVPFFAELDPIDEGSNPGRGLVENDSTIPIDLGQLAFGEDGAFDSSGMQIVNGKEVYTIDFTGVQTVEQMLNALNGSDAGVLAEINKNMTGIDVRSRVSGADFMIGENGGLTATQFGLRTLVQETQLDAMNFGRGVMDYEGPGVKAEAKYESIAENSALVLRALEEGELWNDYDVRFVDTTDPSGAVTIAWDQTAKTITIGITPGVTTANDVIEAFETQAGPRDAFELTLDKSANVSNTGEGVLYKGSTITEGGEDGGIDFTITRHDGAVLEVNINGCTTIGDVLDRINNDPENADGRLVASLNEYGNGILLTDNSTGETELTVERTKLSMAAIDLGLIPDGVMQQTETNLGTIAQTTATPSVGTNNSIFFQARYTGTYANDVQIVYQEKAPADPASFVVSTDPLGNYVFTFNVESGVTTGQDIIDLFNTTPGYDNIRALFQAIPDGDVTGVVDVLAGPETWALSGGESANLVGEDTNPEETKSLFTSLLRLQSGLENNDIIEIQRAVELVDESVVHMNYARAKFGANQQSLDILQYRLDEEKVELKSVLSDAHDVDMVEVISNLTTRQVAMEAGFKAIADTFKLSLIDYL